RRCRMPSATSTRPAPADRSATSARRLSRARGGAGTPWSRLPAWLRRSALFGALVALWQLYVVLADVSPLVFAAPWDVAVAFAQGWARGGLAGPPPSTLRAPGTGRALG